MLAKSSKSRFAAIAIMALGVSTFMGTSAAVANSVTVSGTVGCTATSSTVSASTVAFGAVAKGTTGLASLTPSITQGKNTDCSARNPLVLATISYFIGQAAAGLGAKQVIVAIGPIDSGVFPLTADVPTGAETGTFGATVTLILSE